MAVAALYYRTYGLRRARLYRFCDLPPVVLWHGRGADERQAASGKPILVRENSTEPVGSLPVNFAAYAPSAADPGDCRAWAGIRPRLERLSQAGWPPSAAALCGRAGFCPV